MKKILVPAILYPFLVGIPLILILHLNTQLPVLTSGSRVPEEIAGRNCAIRFSSGAMSPGENSFILKQGTGGEDLCLLLGDMPPFALYLNDRSVSRYDGSDRVELLHSVSLSPDLWEEGRLTIRLESDQKSATWAHVMLGTAERIAGTVQRVSVLFYLLNGTLLAVIFCSLCLYWNKRSERYLLFLSVAAIVSSLLSALQCNMFDLPIPLALLEGVKLPLALLPTVLFGMACVRIFEVDMGRLRALYTLGGGAVHFLVVLLVRLYLPDLYWPVLTVSYLVAACPAVCACVQKRRYAWVVLVGLALRQATRHYGTLVTTGFVAVTELRFYFSFIISDMLFLSPCLLTTYDRFAQKFVQAEVLAQELEEINATLDQRVARRTSQLAIEKEKIKLLEERKHSMMLNIFHDLRSPLHIAMGNLEMLSDHVGARDGSIQTMQRQLDFMQRLVQDLFLVSKLEEKGISFQSETVFLGPLCEGLLQDHESAAVQRDIRFSLVGEAPPICADRLRTGQLLQNIIENALIYTPEGGSITVALAPAGPMASVAVTDTGGGILPADLPFVFDRYFTGTRRKRPQSTGLGLCIAQELARGMGGYIEVQSEKGQGSTFTVYLPIQMHSLER